MPDVNVLPNAIDAASTHHRTARQWLERSLSETEPTGFAWLALIGFVRIATNPDVYPHPLTPAQALDLVDEWLEHPNTAVATPGERHRQIVRRLLETAGTAGNLTSDAQLAAIAIERGATLASFDADFHRFTEMQLEYLG